MTPETFQFALRKAKLRQTRRREGCYWLRSNLTTPDPALLWRDSIPLTEPTACQQPSNSKPVNWLRD